jgi:hypothetical protein
MEKEGEGKGREGKGREGKGNADCIQMLLSDTFQTPRRADTRLLKA